MLAPLLVVTLGVGLQAGVAAADPPETGPGSLDSSFGDTGRVQYGNGFRDSFDSVVVQPDGKIVAGFVTAGGGGMYIYRLLANGSTDPGWNEGSPYYWQASTPADAPKAAIAQDSLGRTYVTSAVDNDGTELGVLRLTAAGQPDDTWATGNTSFETGVVALYLGHRPNDHGSSLVIDESRNRVYVGVWVGQSSNTSLLDFGIVALAMDESDDYYAGEVDESFGGGTPSLDFNGDDDSVRDIALMPDGDVLAVGYATSEPGDPVAGLWRLNPDGTPDTAFGSDSERPGVVEYAGATNNVVGARSVAVDPASGRIYLSVRYDNGESTTGGVVALNDDGTVDENFGRRSAATGDGLVLTGFGPDGDNAGIAVDKAGRAVVVGGAGAPTVARLVGDRYAQDTTFNGSGSETLTCPGGTAGAAQGVAVQLDGQIVVTGTCPEAVAPHYADVNVVWRLNGGDTVPLPATPVGFQATSNQSELTASGISVNGQGRSITVAPGDSLALSFTWTFAGLDGGQDNCDAACIEQVIAGFVNRGPELCAEAGTPERFGATGTLAGSLNAPTTPGRYYIAFGKVQEFTCGSSGPGHWTFDGKFWGNNATPVPASYLVAVDVTDTPEVPEPTLTADSPTVDAGQRIVAVDDISKDDLTGSLNALQSAPLRGSMLRGSPLRGSMLRGSPLRGSMLRGSPLRGSMLRGSPLRGSPIPLSEVPLDQPNSWAAVLAGTIYASQPLQNVTLQQVLELDPPGLAGLTLADIDIARTPLRNASLAAIMLGSTPVSALRSGERPSLPAGTDPATTTLLGLELGGRDLTSFYSSGLHLRGVSFVDAPVATARLGDIALDQTPLGAVPLAQLPGSWYDSSGCAAPCTTLGQLQLAKPADGIKDAATVGALLSLSPAVGGDPTIGQLLPGLVDLDQLGYENVPTDRLAAAAPLPASGVTYTATFTLDCSDAPADLTAAFTLPAGFRPIPATASMTQGESSIPGVTGAPDGEGNFVVTAVGYACEGTPTVQASVDAEPGIALGPTTASVTVGFGEFSTSVPDSAPVTVVDPSEPTPVPTDSYGPVATVFLGYVSSAGDQDVFTLPHLDAGSQLTVRLGHVPAGHDYDLSVFGPGTAPLHNSAEGSPLRGSMLRGSPLRGSAVDDTLLDPATDAGTAATEPQPDVPVQPPTGSSVLGISANRNDAGESLAYTVPDGVSTGGTTIVVSGYNGSNSTTAPYSLLVSVTPPPGAPSCATPSFPSAGQGARGATVSSLPAGTETVILTNKKRLGDLYGSAAATGVMAKLGTLAARTDVNGVVVPVDGNSAVQAAFDAWDADSCSPARANAVVTAINAYVDSLRGSAPNLKYLVIAGNDLVVPMGRVSDRMDLENESGYAQDQVYSGEENPLSAALRGSYLLTDDVYGDLNPIPWLDSYAYVPDLAVGRLVETPADITKAVDQFVSSNGRRSPTKAYTAGYDFNADGAQAVANTLAGRLPAGASTTSINGTWTRDDAIAGLAAAAKGYVSINAHYDAYRALPANEFSGGTQNQLLTSADLPADLTGGVLFTIGCHAGLNVADTFVASPTEAVRKADFTQTIANRGGVSAANTGYGYGDTDAVAYSEKLMADFAKNLDGSMTVGQALMFAKQSYVHLPLSVVDAKVIQQATFYGLPMYKMGATGTAAPATLPSVPGADGTQTDTGTLVTAAFDGTGPRSLAVQNTGRGTWFGVKAGSAPVQAPLAIPGRPLQPETSDEYPQRTDGKTAHGVLLETLSTKVTAASGGFDPVYSAAVPDSSTTAPEPPTVGAFFPSTLVNLVERATPQGLRDVVVLHPGQFRSAGPRTGLGYQQLADSMGYRILYSDSADVTPPAIGTVDGSVSGGQVTFTVTTPDSDAASATVLYLARSSTSYQQWQQVTLTSTDGGHTFTGSDAVSTDTVEQFFVQLVDSANNVSTSSKKGQDFQAPAQPVADAPVLQVTGTPVNGSYTGAQEVVITGQAPVTYSVDGGVVEPYTGPFIVSGVGPHTVAASDAGGSAELRFTIAATPAPTVSISSPSATTSYVEGDAIPASVVCAGYDVTSCTGSPATPDNSLGTHTFTATAKDAAGRTGTASVTYTVRKAPFVGFLSPVNDPPGSKGNEYKRNSTIPLKFQLVDANGATIPDARAAALAASCDAVLSYADAGTPTAPIVNPVYVTAGSGGCFGYSGKRFQYDLKTKDMLAGHDYLLRVRFTSGWTSDHVLRITLR